MYSEEEDMEEAEYSSVDEEEDDDEEEDMDESDSEDEEPDEEDEAPPPLDHEDAEDEEESASGEDDTRQEEEWGGFGGHSSDLEQDMNAPQAQTSVPPEKPVPGTRYVPPHLRNRQADSESEKQSEEQLKLTRQLKGLLNRCARSIKTSHYIV